MSNEPEEVDDSGLIDAVIGWAKQDSDLGGVLNVLKTEPLSSAEASVYFTGPDGTKYTVTKMTVEIAEVVKGEEEDED